MYCATCHDIDPDTAAEVYLRDTHAARHLILFAYELRMKYGDAWEDRFQVHSLVAQPHPSDPIDVVIAAADLVIDAAYSLVQHVRRDAEEQKQRKEVPR